MTKEKFLELVKVKTDDGIPKTFSLFGKFIDEMDLDEAKATCLWIANELKKYNYPFGGRTRYDQWLFPFLSNFLYNR